MSIDYRLAVILAAEFGSELGLRYGIIQSGLSLMNWLIKLSNLSKQSKKAITVYDRSWARSVLNQMFWRLYRVIWSIVKAYLLGGAMGSVIAFLLTRNYGMEMLSFPMK